MASSLSRCGMHGKRTTQAKGSSQAQVVIESGLPAVSSPETNFDNRVNELSAIVLQQNILLNTMRQVLVDKGIMKGSA